MGQKISKQTETTEKAPFGHAKTASFVCAVLEEFILAVGVTVLSIYFNQYIIWFGFFLLLLFISLFTSSYGSDLNIMYPAY